jgi:hypothetical protein
VVFTTVQKFMPEEDGATVPIYYEGRLAKLELKPLGAPKDRRRV